MNDLTQESIDLLIDLFNYGGSQTFSIDDPRVNELKCAELITVNNDPDFLTWDLIPVKLSDKGMLHAILYKDEQNYKTKNLSE